MFSQLSPIIFHNITKYIVKCYKASKTPKAQFLKPHSLIPQSLHSTFAKLSIGVDVLQQIICTIKIRRAPARHDNIDFRPIITRTSDILPLSVVTGDKGYDSEDNHVLVREELYAFSVIPARYEHVPIWRTHGKYRKQMKRGYSKLLYNQRNKDETIISVIKRLFGEHITSRLVRTQNRELSFRCIAYNTHRLTNLTIITWFLQSHSLVQDILMN